jgi:hypothetical protein
VKCVLLFAAVLAMFALTGPAVAGAPPKEQATAGSVTASLFYTRKQYAWTNLRVQITRAGSVLVDQRVPPYPGHSTYAVDPAGFGTHRSLAARDLDGDGEPEVLLDLSWGGAHCCFWTRVYRYDPARGSYVVELHFWGDPSYRLKDLNGDGKPEFITADDRFAYRFTSFAFSGMPIRIWSYRHGSFTDVTRRFPNQVGTDAARQWRYYLDAGRQYHQPFAYGGFLASWAADEYRLGHGTKVERALRNALRSMQLGNPAQGRAYVRDLKHFLRATGYIRG